MEPVSIRDIAAVTGGELMGADGVITSVAIDSRKVTLGTLFCALPGEKADGHDFVGAAFDAGAACCLVTHAPDGVSESMVVVPDVEKAIKALAEWYRGKFDIPVIGIVGSVGKTTAKEMVSSVLGQRFNVLKTDGNFNNELGVPLTLFRLEKSHEIAVVEMGISDFGEMTRLARMARPTMAVFTIIGYGHLEKLHDRDGVFRAKTEILDFMPENGTVFINGDDDKLAAMVCPQKKISFGLDSACNVHAENVISQSGDGSECDIVSGGRRIHVSIPAFGAHMIYAALEGAAVGIAFGLTDDEIISGVAGYQGVGRRAKHISTGYIDIMDDCYNSNPNSASSAIVSLGALPGRKVCILGDMLELGEDSQKLHYGLGSFAAENGMDAVICCGNEAQYIAQGAREHGKRPQAWYFPDKEALLDALPMLIKQGDAVLVKASRGMHFESIVDALMEMK